MNQLPKYFRAISGLNGLMFLMLGLAVLNYGSRLETMISSTKNTSQFNRDSNFGETSEFIKRGNYRRMFESSYDFVNLNEHSRKILHGLDQRIFLITILLSMLFFIVSVSEFLTAWDIVQKSS